MKVEGTTTVREMLAALELTEDALPRSSSLEMTDEIDFSVIADEDALEKEFETDPEPLSYLVDKQTVIELSSAIRRGDTPEAELLLDRLFGDFSEAAEVLEWVQQGRFSRNARQPTPALAKAA